MKTTNRPAGAAYRPGRQVLPMLLERLADSAPDPHEDLGFAWASLRNSVRSNLQALLNCTRPAYPYALPAGGHLENSVLNFGMPPLAGKVVSEIGWQEIADAMKKAIIRFEPRIIADGLIIDNPPVEPVSPHILSLVIQGQIWWSPDPVEFVYYSHVDLESGHFILSEQG